MSSKLYKDKNISWIKDYIKDKKISNIVLFGSYDRNKNKARDIDILFIGDKFKFINFFDRRAIFKFNSEKYIDLFCYTLEEFNKLFDKNHIFIQNIKKSYTNIKGDFGATI